MAVEVEKPVWGRNQRRVGEERREEERERGECRGRERKARMEDAKQDGRQSKEDQERRKERKGQKIQGKFQRRRLRSRSQMGPDLRQQVELEGKTRASRTWWPRRRSSTRPRLSSGSPRGLRAGVS